MNTSINANHQSVNILAFDTSLEEASIALWACGNMRQIRIPAGKGAHSQAALLLPLMQDLLKEENLTFQDLDIIATSVGPGSFTGIRLGLAAAQGLIIATQAKAFTQTTFEIFAFNAGYERDQSTLVTIPTKRDSFYTQAFDLTLAPLSPSTIHTQEEIDTFLKNNSNMQHIQTLEIPAAETLIHLYHYRSEAGLDLPASLQPSYVHDPEFVKQKPCSL